MWVSSWVKRGQKLSGRSCSATANVTPSDMQDAPAFIPAIFLTGVRRSMRTMPMLKTWTPPPDM